MPAEWAVGTGSTRSTRLPRADQANRTWRSGTWPSRALAAGVGAAGPPPGNPRGSVLTFGRHVGWSLGEVARVDPGYLQWLATTRDGARYRDEIDAILAEPIRQRAEQSNAPTKRRGLFG